jgi:hypothetical protein
MKRKRHSEEQIIAILKEHEAGVKRPTCAASTQLASRRSTIGSPSMAGWKSPKLSA